MSDHLIMITVFGKTHTLIDYLSTNSDPTVPNIMPLTPGDRVAWVVRVRTGTQLVTVPFEVTFFELDKTTPNKTFLGTEKLSVPAGGASPFLPVLPLKGHIKYAVTAPGVITFDPEMQTGEGVGGLHTAARTKTKGTDYKITWDISGKTVSYTGGGSGTFPAAGLKIAQRDTIVFAATLSGSSPAPPIQVVFDPPHKWASPFDLNDGLVPLGDVKNVGANPTNKETVDDDKDAPGTVFPFQFQTPDLKYVLSGLSLKY
jgi:hypothetical protein